MAGLYFDASLNTSDFNSRLSDMRSNIHNTVTAIESASESIGGLESSMGNAAVAVDSMVGTLMKIGGLLGVGTGLGEIAKNVFNVRSEFQDAESTMKVFLGSAEKATSFMAELKDYAWYNMFEFTDLVQGSKQLLAYGNTVEKVIPILDNLSNVATGTKVPLMEMVNAYNHAKNAGGLDRNAQASWAGKGLVLNDILDEMGEKYDKKFITFDQLNKVLEYVTRDGGMFGGLMDEQMDNLSASYGQLQDNIANMFNEIGVETQDYFKEAIDFGANLVDNYQEILRILSEIALAYGGFRAGQMLMKAIETERLKELEETTNAHNTELEAIQAKIDKQKELLELTKEGKEYVEQNSDTESDNFDVIKGEKEDESNGILDEFDQIVKKREEELALAKEEEEVAQNELESAKESVEAAKEKVEQAKEFAEAWAVANEESDGANDDDEFEAQLELERAQIDLNTASEAELTAAKKVEAAQEKVNIATSNLSTAATNRETAANVSATGAVTAHSVATKSDTISTRIATGAKLLFNSAVGKVKNTLIALKTAIATNPLGALAVAAMAAYEAFQYLTKSSREAEEAQQKFHDSVNESTKSIQAEYDIVNSKSLSSYKQRAESLDTILKAMRENNVASKETIDSLDSEAEKLKYVNSHREELINLIKQEAAARAAADMIAEAKKEVVESASKQDFDEIDNIEESVQDAINNKNTEMLSDVTQQFAELNVLREKENWSAEKYADMQEKIAGDLMQKIELYGKDLNLSAEQVQQWKDNFQKGFGEFNANTALTDGPLLSLTKKMKVADKLMNEFGATENSAAGKTQKFAKEVEKATSDYNKYNEELKRVNEELEKDPTNIQLKVRKEELTQDLNDAKERVKEAAEGMNQDIFLKVQAMVEEEGVEKYQDFINDNREEWDQLVEDIKNNKIKFDGDTTELDIAYHKVLDDMDTIDKGNPCPEFSADITDFMSKVSIAETKEEDFPHVHDFLLNFRSAGEAVINSGIDALNKLIDIYNKIAPEGMQKKKFEHIKLTQGERPDPPKPDPESPKGTGDGKKNKTKTSKPNKKSKTEKKEDKVELSEEEKAQKDLEDTKTEIARKAADARADYEIAKTHDTTRKQIMEYEEQYKAALQTAEDYAEEAEEKILEKLYNSQQIKTGKNSKNVKKWSDLSAKERDAWRKNLAEKDSKELTSTLNKIAETRSDMINKANVEYTENVKKAYSERTKREADVAASWASYYEKAQDYAKRIEYVKKAADKDVDSLYEQLSAATHSNKLVGTSLVSSISTGNRELFDNLLNSLGNVDKTLVESLVSEILNRTKQKDEDIRNIEFEQWQKSIGWETLFNDTDKYSKEALSKILPELKKQSEDPKISIDQRKTIIDLIQKIDDELEKGTFAKSLENFKEGYGFTEKYATNADGTVKKDPKTGKPIKDGYKFDPIKFANQFADDFSKATELAFSLGLDPESTGGKQLQSAADGLNSAAGAAASFMSGDYVGAVVQSVDAIKSFSKVFSPGNVAEMQSIIDLQNSYMEAYALQMEMAKERISDSSKGVETAFNAVRDAAQAYSDSVESANISLDASMRMWDDHHSIGYNFSGLSADMTKAYNSRYGAEYGRFGGSSNDMLKLSPEALRALTSLPEWKKFLVDMRGQVDDSSYQAFVQAVEAKVALANQADEAVNSLVERITGSGFGALVDDFKSAVKDMKTSASDLGNYIQEMINNALSDVAIDDAFRERLNNLQKYIATAAEDGFDDVERAYIKAEKKAAQEEGKRRQQMIKDSGLYEDTDTSQQASGRGYQQMSEDTGQELNGRFTALQIAGESVNTTAQLLLANSNIANTLLTANNVFLSDILAQSSLQTLYLEDIQKDTRKIYNEFSSKLDTMNATLKNI